MSNSDLLVLITDTCLGNPLRINSWCKIHFQLCHSISSEKGQTPHYMTLKQSLIILISGSMPLQSPFTFQGNYSDSHCVTVLMWHKTSIPANIRISREIPCREFQEVS